MRTIKVSKKELLKTLIANKEKHIKEYQEAVEDYKQVVLQMTQTNLKLAKTADLGLFAKIKSIPNAPQVYEKEYSRAIRMLEMSVEDVIELEDDVFNQLVLDEWGWKNQFVATSTLYKTALGR